MKSFVWIGGDGFPNANFYISTAPKPEGPWTPPTVSYFYHMNRSWAILLNALPV